MPTHFDFRKKALSSLTTSIGCYILADLDNIPIYVGQSVDGIRTRVQRHLTSARSDVIANRQIDVWEIAFVWAYPVSLKSDIGRLESSLFHEFDKKSQLMNGSIPKTQGHLSPNPTASQTIQVISDEDLKERLSPELRLPRQAQHFAKLVDHFLVVKQSEQIARSMQAHFERLQIYHKELLDSQK